LCNIVVRIGLIYVTTYLPSWYTVTGTMMVKMSQRVVPYLALYLATDRGVWLVAEKARSQQEQWSMVRDAPHWMV